MKKIVLFIDNLGAGGAQRQIVNIAILLKQNGYNVSVLVYQDDPFYNSILDRVGISIYLIENRSYIDRIIKVRRYLCTAEQDVVIAFLETPGFLACLAKIGGAKWKLITNELSAKESTFKSRKNKIYNFFERLSDVKICNSMNAFKMWKKHYPQYLGKYSVIYNPVNVPSEYCKYPFTFKEKRTVVVAASYQKLKNPLGLIKAVQMLEPIERDAIQIQWYGRAEITNGNAKVYEESCKLVQEYGLDNIIYLNKETSDIYKYMAEGTAVGLFSMVEGLPNAICEAMTIGKPIIMSRVSDYNTLVNGNGFLCDPNSYESICNALREFIYSTDEELQMMGMRSHILAEQLFKPEAIIQKWIKVIEDK